MGRPARELPHIGDAPFEVKLMAAVLDQAWQDAQSQNHLIELERWLGSDDFRLVVGLVGLDHDLVAWRFRARLRSTRNLMLRSRRRTNADRNRAAGVSAA